MINRKEVQDYDGKIGEKNSKIQGADFDNKYFIVDSVGIGLYAYDN